MLIRLALAALATLAAAGCGDSGATLVVDLQTDYLPGTEFTSVDVSLDEAAATGVPAAAGLDFAVGRRLAEYDGVSPGDHSVTVTLLAGDGSEVAHRRTDFTMTGSYGVTVVITRDCAGVACPAMGGDRAATECLGGLCVTPRCHPGDLEACGAADCDTLADCDTGVACVQGICVGGACLHVPRDDLCPAEETCDAVDGCTGPVCVPQTETCDGVLDEDCDGMVDEGCECTIGQTRPCGSAVGACMPGTETCGSTGTWGPCEGAVGPSMEVCDGMVDESCDGTVDEGCTCSVGETRPCGSDVGACSAGVQTCQPGGSWGTCTGATTPTAETCDGVVDENCDGMVDEGCACVNGTTQPCGTDVGACTPGMQTCVSGAFGACVGEVGPTAERCNAIDDDCDGLVDSADACSSPSCVFARRGDRPYLICDENQTFDNARTRCQSYGYDLVKIDDAAEDAWIQSQIGAGDYWIGLRRSTGDFEWVVDRSSPTYMNFAGGTAYDCAYTAGDYWRTRHCNDTRKFICEPPP